MLGPPLPPFSSVQLPSPKGKKAHENIGPDDTSETPTCIFEVVPFLPFPGLSLHNQEGSSKWASLEAPAKTGC